MPPEMMGGAWAGPSASSHCSVENHALAGGVALRPAEAHGDGAVVAGADDAQQLDVREGGAATHPRVHARAMAGT
eukprot:14340566-Alexandrium_andersonii.AAC.1